MAASGCAGHSSLDRRGNASSTPGPSGSNWLKHQEFNLPTKSSAASKPSPFIFVPDIIWYLWSKTVLWFVIECHSWWNGWKVAVSWSERYVWWSLMDTLINWYTWLALPLLDGLWPYPNTLRREVYLLDFWKIPGQWTYLWDVLYLQYRSESDHELDELL